MYSLRVRPRTVHSDTNHSSRLLLMSFGCRKLESTGQWWCKCQRLILDKWNQSKPQELCSVVLHLLSSAVQWDWNKTDYKEAAPTGQIDCNSAGGQCLEGDWHLRLCWSLHWPNWQVGNSHFWLLTGFLWQCHCRRKEGYRLTPCGQWDSVANPPLQRMYLRPHYGEEETRHTERMWL